MSLGTTIAPRTIPFDLYYDAARSRMTLRRFQHVLGVSLAAAILADIQGVDVGAAVTAGMLHDIAKEQSFDFLRADLEARGHPIGPEDEPFPHIWHALAGAVWAEQDFGVTDADTIEAIRLHPTLDADAGPLAQVLFMADYTDATRVWEGVEALRQLARKNFRDALAEAVRTKTEHVGQKGKRVHPRALRALEAFGAKGADRRRGGSG